MQTALPILIAATFPAERTAIGMSASSFAGVLEEGNRMNVLAPLLITSVCGAVNTLVIGPATTKCMRQRKHQETRDGKKSYDAGPHSEEMQRLNKAFGALHGASVLVNIVGCLTTVWYGFSLASRLL